MGSFARHASGPGFEGFTTETAAGHAVTLAPLTQEDRAGLFEIFEQVVADNDGFPHQPPLTWGAFCDTWVEPVTITVAARIGDDLAGAYYLRPNFVGRGAHVANAGYVLARRFRGIGAGRCMVEDSISRAPLLGFDAIQFNLVFESNPARKLYEELGWTVVGRIPRAVDGEDCIVYWRAVG